MDKYRDYCVKNKFSFKRIQPMPRSREKVYFKLTISYDNFKNFMDRYGANKEGLPLLEINIYDEDNIISENQINLRYQFLKMINELKTVKINFYLSDSTLPLYNLLMSKIGWIHQEKTTLSLNLDRNPVPKSHRNFYLESAQGKLVIPEEKLIWFSKPTLDGIKDKVDENVLKDALKLKDIVYNYYCRLDELYKFKEFSDFDKVWLAYDFIKRHIRFASEAVYVQNGVEKRYSPNGINDWASTPLGTYQHKKGLCEGQARLMTILLNNPYIRCDTKAINGSHPLGRHVWSGTVIEGRLYQTCLTMSNVFKRLDQMGYVADDDEIYPKMYTPSSLGDREVINVQNHIRRLKK